MIYNIPTCTHEEERDLLNLVMPWVISVSYDVSTNRLVQIEIAPERDFWFRLQLHYWANPEGEDE